MDEYAGNRVADYFVIAGLPPDPDNQRILDDTSLEVNLKPSHNQEPITDITVIFPGLGENVPDYYQLLESTPSGQPADLNHGSFRAPEVFICYRRGKNKPPLMELNVLYEGIDHPKPGFQLVEFTPNGHSANVNNSTKSSIFITYRRANDLSPCNELVITELAVIVSNKGEEPPHTFIKIDKNLNNSMLGSTVYLCYKRSLNRPDHISLNPVMLERFPQENNPSFPLEDNISLFCLPMGATLECWPADIIRTTTTSTFVLTLPNVQRVYGSVISFYEDYPETKLTESQRKLLKLEKWRAPEERKILAKKCIGLLSKWPFFEAFEKFLFFLYKRVLMGPHDIPLERYISHFLYNVPFPSPERPRILAQLSKTDKIALYQPQELPLPRSGANFRDLITTLGADNTMLLLLLGLTEQKILFHSLRSNLLTSVSEAIMQIFFPFTWQFPYIPLCPVGNCGFIAAPFPFIIGLDSRFFDLYELPSDVNAVDLDTNTLFLSESARKMNLSLKLLPKKPAQVLRNTLTMLKEKCLHYKRLYTEIEMTSDDSELDFEFKLREKEEELELEIQEAFLQFMARVLAGYRSHLLPITRAPTEGVTDVRNLFDRTSFLNTRDRNYHSFYNLMMNTQIFTKFIEECSFVSDVNQSLAFFDDCIDRMARNEDGRLLDSEGANSDTTILILPPDSSDLPQGVEYKYNTLEKLDHSLFYEEPANTGGGNHVDYGKSVHHTHNSMATPLSVAKRTKQEIRSAVKTARKQSESPLLWAKCMLATCYSLWYLNLPAMVLKTDGSVSTLRIGYHLLQRMQKLRLHPVDEICYRVMMQLCGIYSQPVLAVKVLFEMKRCGVHPNAVTYGYYNKAVLESAWPVGIANSSQLLWHKLRNVLTAVWLFKQAGRSFRRMEQSASQLCLNEDKQDGNSAADVNGENALEIGVNEEVNDGEKEITTESKEKDIETVDGPENTAEDKPTGDNTAHTNGEEGESTTTERKMPRTRSFSIVKPAQSKEGEVEGVLAAPGVDTLHEETELQHPGDGDGDERPGQGGEVDGQVDKGKPQLVRYTEIRNKFPHLIKTGAAKALFKPEDEAASGSQKSEKPGIDDNSPESGRSYQAGDPALSSLPSTPVNGLDDQTPTNPRLMVLPEDEVQMGSESNVPGMVPVTKDDPLGALSQPDSGDFKTPTREKAGDLSHRSMSMSDVLGTPFTTPDNTDSNDSQMHRSSTMPFRGELGGSTNELRMGMSNGYLGSISSIAGSRIKSFTGSKAAKLGFSRGKALFSALNTMSPQTNVSAKDTLNTIKSWSNSAATNLSKRYEEIVQGSPAGSGGMAGEANSTVSGEEDKVSQSSTDSSRRLSELPNLEIPQDTWHNLAEDLKNYLWGEPQKLPPPQTQRAADITEQFELLYSSRETKEQEELVISMTVHMTSCSRCSQCGSVLYDEEIMAGWTPEDSNLNTICCWCKQPTVPNLSIKVYDYREHPKDKSSQGQHHPREHFPIHIPYISPLVLRKEMENVLGKEGDSALTDPACPDLHPILYWNLIYIYHRIAVVSHLPELLTRTPSLSIETVHPSWENFDESRVKLLTHWDNPEVYSSLNPSLQQPLHRQWRVRNCPQEPMTVSPLMHSVTKGVGENDLLSALRNILMDRKQKTDRLAGIDSPSKVGTPVRTSQANNKGAGENVTPAGAAVRPSQLEGNTSGTPATPSTPLTHLNTTPMNNASPITAYFSSPRSGRQVVSVYRQILFLTLVAMGQDNIDLTAFDREYRRAFEKLSLKELSLAHPSDQPPGMRELFCRKLFRDLRV